MVRNFEGSNSGDLIEMRTVVVIVIDEIKIKRVVKIHLGNLILKDYCIWDFLLDLGCH